MSHSGPEQCRICRAPTPIRQLAEKLRAVGVSRDDISDFLTTIKHYPASHRSIERHDAHFRREEAASAPVEPVETGDEEWTIQRIGKSKMKRYVEAGLHEVVPSDSEMRSWGKLLADLNAADAEKEKMEMLRRMFQPRQAPALPAGDVIEGEVVARDSQ